MFSLLCLNPHHMSNNKTGEMNDTPTPPQGEEVELKGDFTPIRQDENLKDFYKKEFERVAAANLALTAELAALRGELRDERNKRIAIEGHVDACHEELAKLTSQLSEARENYGKVWDAAAAYERAEWWLELGTSRRFKKAPDKTTFINKIKKGKE
jgi:hypothetical protein